MAEILQNYIFSRHRRSTANDSCKTASFSRSTTHLGLKRRRFLHFCRIFHRIGRPP